MTSKFSIGALVGALALFAAPKAEAATFELSYTAHLVGGIPFNGVAGLAIYLRYFDDESRCGTKQCSSDTHLVVRNDARFPRMQ